MTKRTFIKSFMGAIATVALAPEICFGGKLGLPQLPEMELVFVAFRDVRGEFHQCLTAPSTQELHKMVGITGTNIEDWKFCCVSRPKDDPKWVLRIEMP